MPIKCVMITSQSCDPAVNGLALGLNTQIFNIPSSHRLDWFNKAALLQSTKSRSIVVRVTPSWKWFTPASLASFLQKTDRFQMRAYELAFTTVITQRLAFQLFLKWPEKVYFFTIHLLFYSALRFLWDKENDIGKWRITICNIQTASMSIKYRTYIVNVTRVLCASS